MGGGRKRRGEERSGKEKGKEGNGRKRLRKGAKWETKEKERKKNNRGNSKCRVNGLICFTNLLATATTLSFLLLRMSLLLCEKKNILNKKICFEKEEPTFF